MHRTFLQDIPWAITIAKGFAIIVQEKFSFIAKAITVKAIIELMIAPIFNSATKDKGGK